MDWIHCNQCYIQPSGQERRRFMLTSCGHVFCSQCCMTCANDKCKVCQSLCKIIPLSSKMKPDVEVFFTNPMELARRCLASFTQAAAKMQTVSDFQSGHRQRLYDHMRGEMRTLQQQVRSGGQLEARCRQLQKQCRELEDRLVQLKSCRSPRSGSSPGFLSGMVSSQPVCRSSPGSAAMVAAAAAPDRNPYMDVVRRARPFELASVGGVTGSPMTVSPQQQGNGRQTSLLAKLFASPGAPRSPNNI